MGSTGLPRVMQFSETVTKKHFNWFYWDDLTQDSSQWREDFFSWKGRRDSSRGKTPTHHL
ncbi:hypothetical protein INR49_016674 [Caranx melampygus]|nr:hypothetical protein INR49_016674 [Caranx melampygus]